MASDRVVIGCAHAPPEAGFTLIEAMVALCILAIAACALMGAAGADITRVTHLEKRAMAQIVAENQLVGLRLARSRPADSMERVRMGRSDWDVATVTSSTTDPDLVDTKVTVFTIDTHESILTLEGFIDGGASP